MIKTIMTIVMLMAFAASAQAGEADYETTMKWLKSKLDGHRIESTALKARRENRSTMYVETRFYYDLEKNTIRTDQEAYLPTRSSPEQSDYNNTQKVATLVVGEIKHSNTIEPFIFRVKDKFWNLFLRQTVVLPSETYIGISFSFTTKKMAERVQKAFKHAVKLAKQKEADEPF